MTRLGPYEVHPFADWFPLIEGKEFAELVASIKQRGLDKPIMLSHDKSMIIDGRNRYLACIEAMDDPVFETLPEYYDELMILDYVMDCNVRRRDLTVGQRARIAERYLENFQALAKERQREAGERNSKFPNRTSGTEVVADLRQPSPEMSDSPADRKSSAQAARAVGVSPRAVQQSRRVTRDAPDLAAEIDAGRKSLDAAYRETIARPRPEPAPAPTSGQDMLTLRTHDGTPVLYPKPKGKSTFNRTTGPGISWAGWSWNPVTGCLHGCDYCYARELATKPGYSATYPVGFTPLLHTERLSAPANTPVPAGVASNPELGRVFVCSMADLYGRWVPDEWIQQVHGACLDNPQWQYLMLTKFPSRYTTVELPPTAWIGTSVDSQKRVRIAEDAFRSIDNVAVKWLSLEPLLEPLEFSDLSVFDWVVIGAQTETRQPTGPVQAFAPPFEWVARIVAQAREAGCQVHLKPNLLGQVGPQLPGMRLPDEYPEVRKIPAGRFEQMQISM
jgi:protein gp37